MNKKKVILIIWAVCVIALVAGGITFMISKRPPDFSKLSDPDVLKYLSLKDISTLDQDQFNTFAEKVEKISHDTRYQFVATMPDRRQKLFKKNNDKLAEARYMKRVDEYFSLPQDQRTQFLDQQIDRMVKRTGNLPGTNRNGIQERRGEMLSNVTPDQQTKITEYFKELDQRKQQRGIR